MTVAINDFLIEQVISDPLYQILPTGDIFSPIMQNGRVCKYGSMREIGSIDGKGYSQFRYKGARLRTHRVIYRKFCGPLDPLKQINHKNGDRLDNRVENLELCTQSQNNLHRYRVLNRKAVIGNSKIDFQTAERIRMLRKEGWTYKELVHKFGLAKSSISCIVKNKTWKRF